MYTILNYILYEFSWHSFKGAQICETFKPDHKEDPNPSVAPEVKSECRREEKVGTETEFQEDTTDNAAQEVIDDCFPDPIDAWSNVLLFPSPGLGYWGFFIPSFLRIV